MEMFNCVCSFSFQNIITMSSNNKDMTQARKYNITKTKISLSALRIPAVKSFLDLPPAVLESIQDFAKHTHDYEKKVPEGPRDNNEYIYICRTCGHVQH